MIIRFLLLITLLCGYIPDIFGQHCSTIHMTCIYDVDSTLLASVYLNGKEIDSTLYFDAKGNTHHVLFALPEYKGGYDSLKQFLIKQFKKQVNEEESGSALVYIFMANGKIDEIRISKRFGYQKAYDPIIKEVLMKTQNNWIVNNNSKILFVYLFHMNYK